MTQTIVSQSHHTPVAAVDAPHQSQCKNSVCSTAVTLDSWVGGTGACTLKERNRLLTGRTNGHCCCCRHICCKPTVNTCVCYDRPLWSPAPLQASQHKGCCCCCHKWTVPRHKERAHTQSTGTSALRQCAGSTVLTSRKEKQAGTPHTTGNTHCNTNVETHSFW
jgi:hypothetical protein